MPQEVKHCFPSFFIFPLRMLVHSTITYKAIAAKVCTHQGDRG